jgi:hypothetical protein
VSQDTGPVEGHVQITVGEALPGQLRAWTELWSKLLTPTETEKFRLAAGGATEPEDSGPPSASKAEQASAEVSERSEGARPHVSLQPPE